MREVKVLVSVSGYPRIGKQRELKKWIESYFKGGLTEQELIKNAEELRLSQIKLLREKGVDYIPSNDFSMYDNILDTAVMLNIIPAQYQNLDLTPLGKYFAMAKGYQKDGADVKALAMKKWFTTNYHYIVPVIDDSVDIKLNAEKVIREYKTAKDLGIETKPVIVGVFTFVKLSKFETSKNQNEIINKIKNTYIELFQELSKAGVKTVQIDEPMLVTDLDKQDIELFKSVYNELLKHKNGISVLLNTYFGDIRDIYQDVMAMDFDAYGLDFVEGQKNLDLIKKYGFASNKQLFAGVINSRNIWRNNYEQSLELLNALKQYVPAQNIVISSACSLMFVPYTIQLETSLTKDILAQFAFAEEKLDELNDLRLLFASGDYKAEKKYQDNVELIKQKAQNQDYIDLDVREKVKNLTEKDFVRTPNFETRFDIQYKKLGLPKLPTTTIGSFPQTAEVKRNRARFKKGEITKEQYDQNIKEFIKQAVKYQDELGIDVYVHGEFERNDMVEYFGENLSGFIFTQNGWVQSYGTRCVKPPIIWGDVKRLKPITVPYIVYAQSLTGKPMKGMLTGPVTILNWSFPRIDMPLQDICFQIALAIKEEVMDLEKNGIKIIQIDEAALREKLPLRKSEWKQYLDYAIKAFRLVHSSVKPETQIHTHMCYSEFGDIIKEIDDMDADCISFEASRSNLELLDDLQASGFKTAVGPGVYDIHSPRVPAKEEIKAAIYKMIEKLGVKKLWINPDCGLKTRGWDETLKSLKNVTDAVKEIRAEKGL
ncbi:MAG TPA: 5-methyltetrahydropteroyltriglutamate--homocysteine S-methyltransferase [Clostridia bacterium]